MPEQSTSANITPDQMASLKQQLLDEQARLTANREDNRAREMGDSEEDEAGELSHNDPNDPADEASNLYDRDRMTATIDNESRILTKINRALAKMDEGTYGLSDIDDTPIPLARLEALPYALTTIEQEEQGY